MTTATPTLPRVETAALPVHGPVTGLTLEREGKLIDITHSDVLDWSDPYEDTSHMDGVEDHAREWLDETAIIEFGYEDGEVYKNEFMQVECYDVFACIVTDRIPKDELAFKDDETYTVDADNHQGWEQVSINYTLEKLYCPQLRRMFTVVVGEVSA